MSAMSAGPAPAVEASAIATPDRRLRVFVSSTLGELAEERRAVGEVIQRLRLTPVMFESGARPHPPRELYRSYLAQSDVFVGVYWQRYGWVAPDEDVSGLEDEYRLSGSRPKLIYVKAPAGDREPRLADLLTRVRDDDHASYKRFTTADELADLLADDLAVLLTERFAGPREAAPDAGAGRLPVPPTSLLDREDDVAAVRALLRGPEARLVTLLGPGGIGKTRLALEVAAGLVGEVDVRFVDLTTVTDAALVPQAVAAAMGVRPRGGRPVLDLLADLLADRRVLLVLDNLEHLPAAAGDVARLLASGPGVRVLATSRTVLGVRGERSYAVEPLATPTRALSGLDDVAAAPAVRLFVARAKEARPAFALTAANAAVLAEIVRRLDGIPLALELAAVQLRVLGPDALLRRMDARLDLRAGQVDLPDRQRTLRAAIGWSFDLLGADEQALLARLSVFPGGWTLEAAEAVTSDGDVLAGLTALVASSLVVVDDRADVRFRMLETVREYACERLAERGELARTQERLARRQQELSAALGADLARSATGGAFARADAELANGQAAVQWCIDHDDAAGAMRTLVPAFHYLWVRGLMAPTLQLIDEVDALPSAKRLSAPTAGWLRLFRAVAMIQLGRFAESATVLRRLLDDPGAATDVGLAARARSALGWVLPPDTHGDEARALLDAAVAALRPTDDAVALVFALTLRGLFALLEGDPALATSLHREALDRAERVDNGYLQTQALNQLGQDALWSGDPAAARDRYAASAERTGDLDDPVGRLQLLNGFAGVALRTGRPEAAAQLFGAAGRLSATTGIAVWPLERPLVERLQQDVRARMEERELSRAVDGCAALRPEDALNYALRATSGIAAGRGGA